MAVLCFNSRPDSKVKDILLKCIQMGFKPKIKYLFPLIKNQNKEVFDIIKIFIKCGVDVLEKNKEGKTIFDLLKENAIS